MAALVYWILRVALVPKGTDQTQLIIDNNKQRESTSFHGKDFDTDTQSLTQRNKKQVLKTKI